MYIILCEYKTHLLEKYIVRVICREEMVAFNEHNSCTCVVFFLYVARSREVIQPTVSVCMEER